MDAAAKQQVVERLKQASNVLVTVSNNPSVDQLSACIGLTLLLNRVNKHATAVFSGKIPSTIEFLQPEKTIETNTDSLRDFIISLDKSKADKLRYKVEDQVVRIFITPYRTSLSEKDLVFSQGDFNIEVVLALGIHDRSQIDTAISAHGRILHDATVISLNAGKGEAPNLGQVNWQDPTASSLCEMLVDISETLGPGLIDNQMATAFLTGIVAETQRFSNEKTSSRVMTMSAQLMAAGANQQLIVSKLEPPPPPPEAPPAKPRSPKPASPPPKPPTDAGILNISHEPAKPDGQEVDIAPNEIHIDEQGNLKTAQELKTELEKTKHLPKKTNTPSPPPPPKIELKPTLPELPEEVLPPPPTTPKLDLPVPGSHALLDPLAHQPALDSPFTANTQPEWFDRNQTVPTDPLSVSPADHSSLMDHKLAPSQTDTTSPSTSSPQQPTQTFVPRVDSARSAVQNAIASAPFDPALHPVTSLNAQPIFNLHNGSTTEPQAPAVTPPQPSVITPTIPSYLPEQGVAPPPVPPPIQFPQNTNSANGVYRPGLPGSPTQPTI